MARPLKYDTNLLVRMDQAMLDGIDQVLEEGEARADFVRLAIAELRARRLKRMARQAQLERSTALQA